MKKAIIVAGLGFGDEGKGSIVDALVHRHSADLVCRYSGGAQAAHNVITPDGRHHTFAQFGSGTLLGARTFLSDRVLVEPLAALREAKHLVELGVTNPLEQLYVDRRAPVITIYHIFANRCRERDRGQAAHGTCGMGIGETRRDALENPGEVLRVGDLLDASTTRDKLARTRERFADVWDPFNDDALAKSEAGFREFAAAARIVDGTWLADQARRTETLVLEGAQGVLLDQTWGFQPHTTWSDTTFAWADELLASIEFDGEVERLGVTRAYQTRHGAGPLPTEWHIGEIVEPHNTGGFAGPFRQGHLDLGLLRYAIAVAGGVDCLAVTHLDRQPHWNLCTRWRTPDIPGLIESDRIVLGRLPTLARQNALTQALFDLDHRGFELEHLSGEALARRLETELDAPAVTRSYGPTRDDKRFSR